MRFQLKIIGAFLIAAFISIACHGQAPTDFHWIDFKQDVSTVAKIEEALKSENYSAIREIGVLGDFALVMTSYRELDQPTPLGDEWSAYSVSTKTWNISRLLFGYNLEVKDWITFQSDAPDLGIIYLDCWECEPASLFTALHYEPNEGWRARWMNKQDPKQPGVVLGVTDVGDPYTNEDVDQVFAVLAPPSHSSASVGTWYHSRDLGSGKITDVVSRFSVDPATGKDKAEVLEGADAVKWELRLCTAKDMLPELFGGQSSRACKKLTRQQPK
jgi:hypothetical protein